MGKGPALVKGEEGTNAFSLAKFYYNKNKASTSACASWLDYLTALTATETSPSY